jgi:hypothetical protein
MFKFIPIPESVADVVRRERDDRLGNTNLQPVIADEERSFPCRVCLKDARVGESLLLYSHRPFARPAPHQTLGPVYVHAERCTPFEPSARIPEVVARRMVSYRAFDETFTRILAADVVEGAAIEAHLVRAFSNPRVREVHVHYARTGCFACAVVRSES